MRTFYIFFAHFHVLSIALSRRPIKLFQSSFFKKFRICEYKRISAFICPVFREKKCFSCAGAKEIWSVHEFKFHRFVVFIKSSCTEISNFLKEEFMSSFNEQSHAEKNVSKHLMALWTLACTRNVQTSCCRLINFFTLY